LNIVSKQHDNVNNINSPSAARVVAAGGLAALRSNRTVRMIPWLSVALLHCNEGIFILPGIKDFKHTDWEAVGLTRMNEKATRCDYGMPSEAVR